MNCYSCLGLPDILLIEYQFHIHYMKKRHPETPVRFRSRSNGRIKSYSPCEPLLQPLLTSSSPSIDSTSTIWKRASGNSCKIQIAIQRSDQQLWPLRTVTLAWCDQTSSSPSIDSTSSIWKRASGNSCKIQIAIQPSDQKLWPLRTVTLAWCYHTSSSSSINSTSTIWKAASRNSCKILIEIQRSDKKLQPL